MKLTTAKDRDGYKKPYTFVENSALGKWEHAWKHDE